MRPRIRYDPYDYSIDADPHPVWRRMRDDEPLYRNDELDFWALSRFQDVLDASLDWKTFSSGYGTVLELMTDQWNSLDMMIYKDPPAHDQLRKLVSRAFSPRRISELEPAIRRLAASYLDPLLGSDAFDYVEDFASRLPVAVICTMLGVPDTDHDRLRVWVDAMLHRDPGDTDGRRHLEMERLLAQYFASHVEERREEPRDDMMDDLLDAELETADGAKAKLSTPELLAFIRLLAAAGSETVARLLGWAGAILGRYPDQRARLAKTPALIPNAVEELLRYEAPSPVQARRVTRDVHLYGTTVPEGSRILLLTGSAGRDDREYADPDRFDVGRRFERHLAFGYGIHFCLGAALARLEARVALEETLSRFPDWEVAFDRAEMVHTSTVRGYKSLPIRVRIP